jgi:hypothetical protein
MVSKRNKSEKMFFKLELFSNRPTFFTILHRFEYNWPWRLFFLVFISYRIIKIYLFIFKMCNLIYLNHVQNNSLKQVKPKVAIEWTTLLICIWEIPGIPQALKANTEIASQIKSRPLLSSVLMNYLSIISSFEVYQSYEVYHLTKLSV